jgi:tetratricopeptide (TPR) repeat protein
LREAGESFRRERFDEARRILRPLAKQAPRAASVRELYGLSLYRLGRWAQAAQELEAYRALTGSTEQDPVLADCYRALGRYAEVEELWDELRAASPRAELVAEGRIVAAGALADQGRLDEATRLLAASVSRPTRKPRLHHLRMAYALADLYERAGDLPRARELFARIAASDPGGPTAADTTARHDQGAPFGSDQATRQLQEVREAFAQAHRLGMFTVLWCYLRNPAFKQGDVDYHSAADLTGQANHMGVTIEADIIKQKLPTTNGGFNALENYGRTNKAIYETLTSDHPIDLCRWQVVNNYMGRIGLINSGGESKGASDLADAVRTAVINKRAGGIGLISGRKAFQRPMAEGVDLLNAIQDVYLDGSVTIA